GYRRRGGGGGETPESSVAWLTRWTRRRGCRAAARARGTLLLGRDVEEVSGLTEEISRWRETDSRSSTPIPMSVPPWTSCRITSRTPRRRHWPDGTNTGPSTGMAASRTREVNATIDVVWGTLRRTPRQAGTWPD